MFAAILQALGAACVVAGAVIAFGLGGALLAFGAASLVIGIAIEDG